MTYGTFPTWLYLLSVAWIVLGVACAAVIVVDEFRRPQKMWIMNLVWPLTTLFGAVLWLAAYLAWGRNTPTAIKRNEAQPFPVMVMKATSHCGAGCTL